MDTSTFWVGPFDDPDRYRLTHLLGSGGEGEVWRAVAADGAEVAIKIDSVPEHSNDDWQARASALGKLRVDGLVKVRDAFTGTSRHRLDDEVDTSTQFRYVVMDHVAGTTLRTWLDEHPDAPARHRIRILRRVARTLTALHKGPGAEGSITHGDVKPTNVIISADQRPILVDLGLLRPAGSGPISGRSAAYSSPELRNPDARPSSQADTFSFAVTAMETLTALTPPLDAEGNLDLGATRARIVGSPALRIRPLLRRQLLRSLVVDPERRPPTPIRVFAGRTVASLLVPVIILGAGGSAVALTTGGGTPQAQPESQPRTSMDSLVAPSSTVDAPTTPSRSPASPSPTTKRATPHVRIVQDHGTTLRGYLDGGTEFTLRECGFDVSNVVTRPMPDRSTWGGSRFGVTLTSTYDLKVLSVKRKPIKAPGPKTLSQTFQITCPNNVVLPPDETPTPSPCGRKPWYRLETTYSANADRGTWMEDRGPNTRPFGVLDSRCYPPSQLDFDISDCRTNVDYKITVSYQRDDDPNTIYQRTFEAIHLRARAAGATFITEIAGASHPSRFTGGPAGCPGVETVPYDNLEHEVFSLIFQGITHVRNKQPTLTRTQAVNAFVESITGTDYRMVKGYETRDILAECGKADARPTKWRFRCGRRDPSTAASSPRP